MDKPICNERMQQLLVRAKSLKSMNVPTDWLGVQSFLFPVIYQHRNTAGTPFYVIHQYEDKDFPAGGVTQDGSSLTEYEYHLNEEYLSGKCISKSNAPKNTVHLAKLSMLAIASWENILRVSCPGEQFDIVLSIDDGEYCGTASATIHLSTVRNGQHYFDISPEHIGRFCQPVMCKTFRT